MENNDTFAIIHKSTQDACRQVLSAAGVADFLAGRRLEHWCILKNWKTIAYPASSSYDDILEACQKAGQPGTRACEVCGQQVDPRYLKLVCENCWDDAHS